MSATPRRSGDVLVLCYHAVSEAWVSPLTVTPQRLEEQVLSLLRREYVACTFTEAVHCPPARRTLAVTFDDAFASVARAALPLLDRLGVPGTMFAPTGFVERRAPLSWAGVESWAQTPFADEMEVLGWDELARLRERGWEVGAHTVTHPMLPGLERDDLRSELVESKRACERALGTACRSVAYPYGAVSGAVVEEARAAGYEAGAALPARAWPGHPLAWPRVGVGEKDHPRRFELKTSWAFREACAAAAARRARRALAA